MKAVIGIEQGEIVVRLYNDGVDSAHINYGKLGTVTKEFVLAQLRNMDHEAVEPWEIVALPPVGGVE